MRPFSMILCSLTTGALLLSGACASEDTPAPPPAASSLDAGQSSPPSPEPSQSPSTKKSATKKTSAGATSVKVIDTDFRPVKVTIEVGGRVDWTQIGDQPHSVTAADDSFDSSPDCGPLDSDKCLGEGDTFSHRFEEAGEFIYYCRVHGLPDGTGMVGTVVVR